MQAHSFSLTDTVKETSIIVKKGLDRQVKKKRSDKQNYDMLFINYSLIMALWGFDGDAEKLWDSQGASLLGWLGDL